MLAYQLLISLILIQIQAFITLLHVYCIESFNLSVFVFLIIVVIPTFLSFIESHFNKQAYRMAVWDLQSDEKWGIYGR
jgi:hypothetical protein